MCSQCGAGSYSVDSLAGPTTYGPSCFTCPPSATCKGGNSVLFSIGSWQIVNGIYTLYSCPSGHQLVNSIYGVFSYDTQDCRACQPTEYILNPNSSTFTCQPCPSGAVCNGDTLAGLVPGSVWACNASSGLCSLTSCPPGYERQVTSQLMQQCQLCSASSYCLGGTSPSLACPSGAFSPSGSSGPSECISAVLVAVVISLPLTKDQFSTSQKASFQTALASATGVGSQYVVILSVDTISSRRFAAESIQVSAAVATASQSAVSDVTTSLDTAKINSALLANGLPEGTLLSVTIMNSAATRADGFPVAVAVGSSIGALFAILLLIIAGFFMTRKLIAQYVPSAHINSDKSMEP